MPDPTARRPRASRPSRSARPTAHSKAITDRAASMGGTSLRARHDALVERRARPGGDRRRLGQARRARPLRRAGRGLEGSARIQDAGFTTAIVAGMGGNSLARTCSVGRSARPRTVAARPRLDRPWRPWPRPSTTWRSARDALHHRLEVRHDDRAARLPGGRLGEAHRSRAAGPPRAALRARRRDDDRDLRPEEHRRDPPSRHAPGVLPEPLRTSAAATPR